MPAMLTHDFFGQDACERVLSTVDLYTPDAKDAFQLGNQGPDPLFYLTLLPPLKAFEQLGQAMHHVPPAQIFVEMRRAVDGLPPSDSAVGRAYLAGFTCHYLLDRTMHPLVYFWERGLCQAGVEGLDPTDGGIVHAEIERDLDEMVLFAKRGETILEYRPYEEVLRGRQEMLQVLGQVYFDSVVGPLAEGEPSAVGVYPLSVICFRVAQRMFWSPGGQKMSGISALEVALMKRHYSLVRAMSHRVRREATSDFDNRDHRPWRNPFTGDVGTTSFWDLYEEALEQVESAVSVVLGEGFDDEKAQALTKGCNFCGETVA